MEELSRSELVKGTTLTSQISEETFMLSTGAISYGTIADFLENNSALIFNFSKFIGDNVGNFAINTYRNSHYHSKKNSSAINFIHRNLYQNPKESAICTSKATLLGVISSVATEAALNNGVKELHKHAIHKSNYNTLQQAYFLLHNYVLIDSETINTKRATIELSKIRNSFPLSNDDKEKLFTCSKNTPYIPLEDISSLSALNNDKLCEFIAHYLFNLFCYKYGDGNDVLAQHIENGNLDYPGMDTLLMYYDYLGFTGNHAKELIRTYAIDFDKVSRTQSTYLQASRQLIKDFCLQIPSISIDEVRQRCSCMVQYDPYQLRRKKTQTISINIFKALAGIVSKRPDIAMNGIALALSQFELEDGNIASIMEKEFKNCGMPISDFSAIEAHAENLIETATEYN